MARGKHAGVFPFKLRAGPWPDFTDKPQTKFEDEDDYERVRTVNREVRSAKCEVRTANPLPELLDLLQHSFGNLANLAGSQKREMEQLEEQ